MSLFLSLLLAAAPTTAQARAQSATPAYKAAPPGKVSTANPHTITAYLQKAGYRAKLITGKGAPYVESAADGANFYISLLNCDEQKANCQDVMFRSSYDRNKEKPVKVEAINKFNADNRWARAYLDEEGGPVIEYDVLFATGSGTRAGWRATLSRRATRPDYRRRRSSIPKQATTSLADRPNRARTSAAAEALPPTQQPGPMPGRRSWNS